MEIFIKDKNCIITPLSRCLDGHASSRLNQEIKNHLLFNIGVDMCYVEDCTIDFFETLKHKKNISLFNISSELLTLFNIMGLDRSANLYVLENDFNTGQNRIVNRKLKLV